MKKILLLAVTIVILSGLILAGCAAPAPATPPASKPAPTTPAPAKTVELKVSFGWPAKHAIATRVLEPWAKEVQDASGGSIKITFYPGETLLKFADSYQGVVDGIADATYTCVDMNPDRFSLATVASLPLYGLSGAVQISKAVAATYDKFPDVKAKEFAGAKLIWISSAPGWQVFTREKQIKTLDDFKGQKIVASAEIAPVFTAVGAVPVAMLQPDMYLALERGTIDAITSTWGSVEAFKFQEVLKHSLICNVKGGNCFFVMNEKTWKSMSPDQQKVIDKFSQNWVVENLIKGIDMGEISSKNNVTAALEKRGGTNTTLDPAELTKWQNNVQSIRDAWVSSMDKRGLPGKAMMEEFLKQAALVK
jgi:TRAP-type transport system periplasmic protein